MTTHKSLALLACSLFSLMGGCTYRNLGSLLPGYQYVEVRPPTTLWPPGTIVQITRRDPLTLEVVCTADGFLGPTLPVKSSDSSSLELETKATGTFSLDASYLETLKASGKYTDIEDITLTLSNVSILELPDETIMANLSNRTEACSKALEFRWTGGDKISLVRSVLKADVVMQAKFSKETKLSASEKNVMLQNLAAQLAVDYSSSTNQTMNGKSLYWGIRDEERYAHLDKNGKQIAMVSHNGPIIELAAMEAAKKSGLTLVAYSSRDLSSNAYLAQAARKDQDNFSVFGTTQKIGFAANDDPRQFIYANADNLLEDFARGDGEYVRSLATVLKVPDDSQRVFIEEMKEQLFPRVQSGNSLDK